MNIETSEQILAMAKKNGVLDVLLLQVKKDFLLANCPLDIPLQGSEINAISLIKEKIYFLLMEKFTEYLNLLYAIDIPEKEFKKIDTTDTVVVAHQVTFLILKREYQKVLTRKKYS